MVPIPDLAMVPFVASIECPLLAMNGSIGGSSNGAIGELVDGCIT